MIRTPLRIDAILINLVPRSNLNLKLNGTATRCSIKARTLEYEYQGRHNQLWMILLISQEFECHKNPISSKSLFKNQRELTLSPIASKLIFFIYWMPVHYRGLVTRIFENKANKESI